MFSPVSLPVPALFSLLADPTRLRCAVLLQREGELCVCELVHALDLSQPKVSRHLAVLREGGLVEDRRAGQWVHYRLHPALPAWAVAGVAAAADGAEGADPYEADRARLAAMAGRPERLCCPV
jgi:ArsR family transcriptional regulator